MRKEREDKTNKTDDQILNSSNDLDSNDEINRSPSLSPEPKNNGELSSPSSNPSSPNLSITIKPNENKSNDEMISSLNRKNQTIFNPLLLPQSSPNRNSTNDHMNNNIFPSLRSHSLPIHNQPSFVESVSLLKELTSNHLFAPTFPLKNSLLSAFANER